MNTKQQQIALLRKIVEGIETRLEDRADQWEPDWDGLELRWLLMLAIEEETRPIDKRSRTWRDFINDWRCKNLY